MTVKSLGKEGGRFPWNLHPLNLAQDKRESQFYCSLKRNKCPITHKGLGPGGAFILSKWSCSLPPSTELRVLGHIKIRGLSVSWDHKMNATQGEPFLRTSRSYWNENLDRIMDLQISVSELHLGKYSYHITGEPPPEVYITTLQQP